MNLHCLCGLSKEEVKNLHQDGTVPLADGGLCRNFRADGRRDANDELERCGMALGAHPVQQPAPPGNYHYYTQQIYCPSSGYYFVFLVAIVK